MVPVVGWFCFNPGSFVRLFGTAGQWEPKCGEERAWKRFLPAACAGIETHVVSPDFGGGVRLLVLGYVGARRASHVEPDSSLLRGR